MIQIIVQQFVEIQYFWLIIHQCQHNYAEGVLQLGMFVKLIEYNIWVGVPAQLDTDPHALTVRFIPQIRNAGHALVPYQLRDFFDQTGFIHQIGQFGHDDSVFAVIHGLDFCNGPNPDFAPSGPIGFIDAGSAQNHASGGKIRTFYDLHQFLYGGIPVFLHLIVDQFYHGGNRFPQIVGRDIGCHTHGNSRGAID